jgi:hypothetical protein
MQSGELQTGFQFPGIDEANDLFEAVADERWKYAHSGLNTGMASSLSENCHGSQPEFYILPINDQ